MDSTKSRETRLDLQSTDMLIKYIVFDETPAPLIKKVLSYTAMEKSS